MKLSDDEIDEILDFLNTKVQFKTVAHAIRQLMDERDRYKEALKILANEDRYAIDLVLTDKIIHDCPVTMKPWNIAKQALGEDDAHR